MVLVNATLIPDICTLFTLYPQIYQLTLRTDMALIRYEYPQLIDTLSRYKTKPTPAGLSQFACWMDILWITTEPTSNTYTWFDEIFSCCCLTVLPGPAWVLLYHVCNPYFGAR